MGVAYLADEMYRRIIRNSNLEDKQHHHLATVAAALLHDIGHGPFSHTFEEIFTDVVDSENKVFDHEEMTVRIILEDNEINNLLLTVDADFPELVASFFDKSKRESDHWWYRIVSSQLDADRLDYLLRDSRLAGLQGHGFDLPRLLDMLHAWDDTRVVVDSHATQTVEAYLLMLQHIYQIVYYHKAVRGATTLFGSLMRRSFDLYRSGNNSVFSNTASGKENPLRLLLDQGNQLSVSNYLRLGEFHVWNLVEDWQFSDDVLLSDLARRLMERKRFRTIDIQGNGFAKVIGDHGRIIEAIMKRFPNYSRQDIERYYVRTDDTSRTGYKLYNWSATDGSRVAVDESIWIFTGSKKPEPIENDHENRIFTALKGMTLSSRFVYPNECQTEIEDLFS